MALPSTLSSTLFYISAGLSAFTVLGHTKFGFDSVLPSLKKCGPNDKGGHAASIAFMEVNTVFAMMAILSLKWATLGCNDVYDKALMAVYSGANVWFGYRFTQVGIYAPLVSLWGVPAILGLSQIV